MGACCAPSSSSDAEDEAQHLVSIEDRQTANREKLAHLLHQLSPVVAEESRRIPPYDFYERNWHLYVEFLSPPDDDVDYANGHPSGRYMWRLDDDGGVLVCDPGQDWVRVATVRGVRKRPRFLINEKQMARVINMLPPP